MKNLFTENEKAALETAKEWLAILPAIETAQKAIAPRVETLFSIAGQLRAFALSGFLYVIDRTATGKAMRLARDTEEARLELRERYAKELSFAVISRAWDSLESTLVRALPCLMGEGALTYVAESLADCVDVRHANEYVRACNGLAPSGAWPIEAILL